MIYLDNAATTLKKPPCVAQAVLAALSQFGNSGRGTHASALDAARIVFETREQLARLFHCARADHVCFTANATEALNIAVAGLFQPGDHVLSTDLEHNSVLRPLYRLRDQGVQVEFLPADRRGRIDEAEFERRLRPNTRGIICTHASNLTGDTVDLQRVGAIARRCGAAFVVDASQSAGTLPIDMERQGIDVLCFTGHKGLMGPQGTGGLCLRPGVEIRPWCVGGTGVQSYLETQPPAYPTRLEAGTLNGHGIAGLHAALAFLQEVGAKNICAREQALSRRFYEQVRTVPGVTLYGNYNAPERAAIVSLNLDGRDSGEVSDELSERFEIATRPGAHCAPRLHRALGIEEQGAVRFSWSYFNTEEETDAAAAAVKALAEEGRGACGRSKNG